MGKQTRRAEKKNRKTAADTQLMDELFDAAFEYKELKLWKKLWDDQVFAVRCQDGTVLYACVMGRNGEYTAILYKTERFRVLAYDTYWLTDTPKKHSKVDGSTHYRIATWGLFEDKQTGARFLYTNVVATSRGCPFACDFCYNSCAAVRGSYAHRTVPDVLTEIRSLGTRHVMFIDDNFIGDPAFARELLEAMRPLRLRWNAAVSANVLDMPDLLDLMRDTGCRSLFVGFESLGEDALRGVHKRQNRASRHEALVEALHSRGIMVNASFVFGLDGDGPDVFRATVDWVVRNRVETVTSHILTPYPGTALHARMEAAGRIVDRDLSHYDTAHVVFRPANMTAEQLYEGYLRVYREIYSLRNIARRLPRSPRQWMPYLLFNLLYRKWGRATEAICRRVGYHRIGTLARLAGYAAR